MFQVCCSQRPGTPGRTLLSRASPGDMKTLKGRSGSVCVGSLGPGANKVLFEPSQDLWWVWGFFLKIILPLLPSCWGFSFALGPGASFFGDIQHSPVYGCSAASFNFEVLAGDECTFFYSAIFPHTLIHQRANRKKTTITAN